MLTTDAGTAPLPFGRMGLPPGLASSDLYRMMPQSDDGLVHRLGALALATTLGFMGLEVARTSLLLEAAVARFPGWKPRRRDSLEHLTPPPLPRLARHADRSSLTLAASSGTVTEGKAGRPSPPSTTTQRNRPGHLQADHRTTRRKNLGGLSRGTRRNLQIHLARSTPPAPDRAQGAMHS